LQPLVYIRMWWPPVVKSEWELQFPLRLDYGWSPHAYVNQRLQILLGLLMMSDIPLETCWACNELWNNKFRYQVASWWLLLLSRTTIHGSINIKSVISVAIFYMTSHGGCFCSCCFKGKVLKLLHRVSVVDRLSVELLAMSARFDVSLLYCFVW